LSEEMKLLRSLCEALGFDVTVDFDYQEQKETQEQFLKHIDHVRMFPHAHKDRHFITDGTQAYLIDDEGNYTSELKKPISSYILTKKSSQRGHISRNSK